MQLKYTINNDVNHFVLFDLDVASQLLSAMYLKQGVIEVENEISVADILSIEPSLNPRVQVAKKDNVWDLHLIKYDSTGRQFRRSIGVLTAENVQATNVEITNDSNTGVTLKDYVTHKLDVYDSSLAIASFPFTQLNGVTGTSSVSDPTPQLTGQGQLKMGFQSDISLELFGESAISVNDLPFMLALSIDSLAPNDVSGAHQLEMNIGGNLLRFNTLEGLTLKSDLATEPQVIMSAAELNAFPFPMNCRLIVKPSGVTFNVGSQVIPLTQYHITNPIDRIQLLGFCNGGQYSLINSVYMHALENFRQDGIAPNMVQDVRASVIDGNILVEWSANTEEDLAGYKVYVDNAEHSLGYIQVTEYLISGLPLDIPVRISVTAIDKSGNESPSGTILEITPI